MRNKKGISLIVLVITIIVMIILAASVVITLSNTGIIDKANAAVNTTNVKEVEQYVQLLWSEAYMEGKRTTEDIQAYINSKLEQGIKDKYDIIASEVGVTVIGKGAATEGLTASDIKTNASTYYGTTVEYDSAVEGTTWQLFHSDGTNIYLIAADYVKNTTLPAKNGATPKLHSGSEYTAAFSNGSDGVFAAAAGYTGSASIMDTDMIALNSKYHAWLTANGQTSTHENVKAVAYMLDKSIWTETYGDGSAKTKYVIGGPTLELLYAAYKAKTGNENTCTVSSLNGYEWVGDVAGSPFVLSSTNARFYWIASAARYYDATDYDYVVNVYYDGGVTLDGYYWSNDGAFRPVVCLEPGVRLEKVGDILKIK